MRVLSICKDGTNRSLKLCNYLKEKNIDCVEAGYSDLAKQFNKHYSQIEGSFDYIVLLDNELDLKEARKITDYLWEKYFNGCLIPPISWFEVDETKEEYEELLKEIARLIEMLLKANQTIILSESYWKELQESKEEREQFKDIMDKIHTISEVDNHETTTN